MGLSWDYLHNFIFGEVNVSGLAHDDVHLFHKEYTVFVNYDTEEYIRIDTQSKDSSGLRFHPIPLLLASNNTDGGRYCGYSQKAVGIWACNRVGVVKLNDLILKYFHEIIIDFYEDY